jgi:general secretion pathway protein A
VQLTGEVGTGKTTLSRLVLEQLPDNVRVALVLNPKQTPLELLETICEELHVEMPGKRRSMKVQVDVLSQYLLTAYGEGLRVVLILDEAQELSRECLEQVRLLTNLETASQKLLQIVLLGQPELREMTSRPSMRQLAQRITARYHLMPLDLPDTDAYLRHRFMIAGGSVFPFEPAAVRRLHELAGGVPRLLNVLGERALLAGYVHGKARIDAGLVDQAAREVLAPETRSRRWQRWAIGGGAVLALVAVVGWLWHSGAL